MNVLGVSVHATSYADATARIMRWSAEDRAAYVCCANVHVIMEARDDSEFRRIVEGAHLVTTDGMPLVWYLRALGLPQTRVYGPDLMLHVCAAAAAAGIPIGLLGSKPTTLSMLASNLLRRFPALVIAFQNAPPYRSLTPDEDERLVEQLEHSGARILFVGLGCPKQERWMAAHTSSVRAVMIGVGAAFDFHAGTVRQAPPWIQEHGLEWLYRLSREPRRLTGRYLRHNPRFALRALGGLAQHHLRQQLKRRRAPA